MNLKVEAGLGLYTFNIYIHYLIYEQYSIMMDLNATPPTSPPPTRLCQVDDRLDDFWLDEWPTQVIENELEEDIENYACNVESETNGSSDDDAHNIIVVEGDESTTLDDVDSNERAQLMEKYPNPSIYVSRTYFTFNRASYCLMKEDLLGKRMSDALQIIDVTSPLIVKLSTIKQWNLIKRHLNVNEKGALCLQGSPPIMIPCIEQWKSLVVDAHIINGQHKSCDETLSTLRQEWSCDIRGYGLSSTYVKACIQSCGCQQDKTILLSLVVSSNVDISSILADIQVQFKTRLNTKSKAAADSEIYECHRAGLPRKRGRKVRRSRLSKKCGCSFRVSVKKIRTHGVNKMKIIVFGPHTGHDPNASGEIYHLPVHPNVIACCMDDFSDIGCVRHVAKISIRKVEIHKCRVSQLDQVIYRFFMFSKEIHNNATKLNISKKLSCGNWGSMMEEAHVLMRLGKVQHVQPYISDGEGAQPFVLIIQYEWMFEMACKSSPNNSWAIDSTF